MPAKSQRVLVGILVGGASRRMGRPKGLLPTPPFGESILVRTLRIAREARLETIVVGHALPYASILSGVRRIGDSPARIGPLGGVAALLGYAASLDARAIAVACDMPFVTAAALAALAAHPATAAVVAPRLGDHAPWEPFFARYEPRAVLPPLRAAIDAGTRSFQRLFASLDVTRIDLAADALADWDTPDDVRPPKVTSSAS